MQRDAGACALRRCWMLRVEQTEGPAPCGHMMNDTVAFDEPMLRCYVTLTSQLVLTELQPGNKQDWHSCPQVRFLSVFF